MSKNNSPTTSQKAPGHVAIVMDGNGRWAQARGKSRVFGHQAGVDTVRKIVSHAAKSGTRHLTLYSFSTENWKRPEEEIQALFGLLRSFVHRDLDRLHNEKVCVKVLGNKNNLPQDISEILQDVESKTRLNSGLNLNIAFNYGGRDEIIRMVQNICSQVANGSIQIDAITEKTIASFLDTKGQPDPDLIIRTSGENRLSNFLLWQSAYAEFVLTDVLWPDFTPADYDAALTVYSQRKRRLGGVEL